MEDRPSERLIDQRLRNRAIEALAILAKGEDGIRAVGNSEYVNHFFDTIDDGVSWRWRDISTFTPAEVDALASVQGLLLDACAATPQICSDDEFIDAAKRSFSRGP
jgi:hypothetical protein